MRSGVDPAWSAGRSPGTVKAGTLKGTTGVNLADYALFWPGVVVAVVVAALLAAPFARAMHRPRAVAFGLMLSVGVIVAATLTPGRDALLFGIPGSGACDLSSVALPTIAELRSFNDTSLNVLLFVPLGLILPVAGRPRRAVALLAASVSLPFAIEAIQLVVTPLGRSCQAVDVVNNLTGLVFGVGLAAILVAVTRLLAGVSIRADGASPPS